MLNVPQCLLKSPDAFNKFQDFVYVHHDSSNNHQDNFINHNTVAYRGGDDTRSSISGDIQSKSEIKIKLFLLQFIAVNFLSVVQVFSDKTSFDRCLFFCPFSFGRYVVCSSPIYGFWLSLWYLRFTDSDYLFGILDLRILIISLVSSNTSWDIILS